MMQNLAAALASIVLLASCYPEPSDLRKELRDLSADQRGKVNPLPQLRPPPDASYGAGKLPDPFYPDLRSDQRAAGIRELSTTLTYDDVNAVRPADIQSPFSGKSIEELVSILNDNLRNTQIKTDGCTIEWKWEVKPGAGFPGNQLRVRIDSRDLEAGGIEVFEKRLLYHPNATGDKFTVLSADNAVRRMSSWHTLVIRDASPKRYWVVVGAFQELTAQLRGNCPPRS